MEELLHSKARVYLAHGTRDTIIPIAAHDMVVAEMQARGRDMRSERVEGADHGFQTEAAPKGPPVEMQALLARVLNWFLAP